MLEQGQSVEQGQREEELWTNGNPLFPILTMPLQSQD